MRGPVPAACPVRPAAHRAILGTREPRAVPGVRAIGRCAPWSAPLLSRLQRKLALPCSVGSQVLRCSPTPPGCAGPPCGGPPSRPGLGRRGPETAWRSPGSHAWCFSACRGSSTPQSRRATRVSRSQSCCPPENRVGAVGAIFGVQSPCPPMPVSTLQASSRDDARKTPGQDGGACSFPAGRLHPLQRAGFS